MKPLACLALLIVACLAGPALASDPECQSQTTDEDLCAIAAQAAADAQATLPRVLEDGFAKGFAAVSVVAEGATILTTFTGPQTMDQLTRDLDAQQIPLDTYQRQFENEAIAGVCHVPQTADFIAKGGYFTSVFTTADGKAFAFVDVGSCDSSGN